MSITEIKEKLSNEIVYQYYNDKKVLKQSSIMVYLKRIETLYKVIDFMKSTHIQEVFKNQKDVLSTLYDHYSNPSTISSYLTAIIRMGKIYEYDTTLYEKEQKQLSTTLKKKQQSQKMSTSEKTNWVSYTTLIRLLKQLDKKAQKSGNVKDHEKALLLALFTLMPPRRREYGDVHIVMQGEKRDKHKNYFVLSKKLKKGTFYFGDYKTSGWYGVQRIRAPVNIVRRVVKLLKVRGIPLPCYLFEFAHTYETAQ